MNIILNTDKSYRLSELAKAIQLNGGDTLYLEQIIDGKLVSIGVDRDTFLAGILPSGKFIVSGGAVWTGTGMVFETTPIEYWFFGVFNTVPADPSVVLSNGGADPRIDAIVVNADLNTIEVVQGTEDANPVTPIIGEDQIVVQYVLVPAGALVPVITEENIYKNNAEWVGSTAGTITGSVDFDNTDVPCEGTKSVRVVDCDKRAKVRFTNGSTVDLADFPLLTLTIKFPSAIAGNRRLQANFMNAGSIVGSPVNLMNSGLSRTNLDCQQLIVSTASFGVGDVDGFQLRMVGGANNDNASWDADNIFIYSGFAPPTTDTKISIENDGTAVGDTSTINFVPGTNISFNITQDINGKISVEIISAGGGGGAFIPLSGTTVGNPVTGNIELSAGVKIILSDVSGDIQFIEGRVDGTIEIGSDAYGVEISADAGLKVLNGINSSGLNSEDGTTPITLGMSNITDGLRGSAYYAAHYADNSFVQKKYVDDNSFALNSGVISGGVVSPDGALGVATTFDVAAGTGFILDWTDPLNPKGTAITWPEFLNQAVPNIGTELFTTISIVESATPGIGEIVLGNTLITPQENRSLISLQGVVHTDLATITSIGSSSKPAYEIVEALLDYINDLGPINQGNQYSENGANLSINKATGGTTFPFINRDTSPQNPTQKTNIAQILPSFTTFYRDGVGGFTVVPSQTTVDPQNYDDGSGTLVPLTNNNRYQIKRIYFFGQTGTSAVTYGQAEYMTLDDAKANIFLENPVVNPVFQRGTFVTALIIKKGVTNLTTAVAGGDAEFVPITSHTSGGGSGSVGNFLTQDTNQLTGNTGNKLLSADWQYDRTSVQIEALGVLSLVNLRILDEKTKEEAIQGTATYDAAMTGAENLDLSLFADHYGILTGNVTLTVSNEPASGKTFVRSLTLKTTAAESLTLPVSWIVVGEFTPDTEENNFEIKFTNYPTVGAKVWCFINQES